MCEECGNHMTDHRVIRHPEGYKPEGCRPQMLSVTCPGDWIIKEGRGKYYPCKPDVFKETYEPVEDHRAFKTDADVKTFWDYLDEKTQGKFREFDKARREAERLAQDRVIS